MRQDKGSEAELRQYRFKPTVISNYKVGVLFSNGYVSFTNHDSIQEACEEMRCLLYSWYNDQNFSKGEVWKPILNVWIEG